jgi:hypothetical protein
MFEFILLRNILYSFEFYEKIDLLIKLKELHKSNYLIKIQIIALKYFNDQVISLLKVSLINFIYHF